jgi:hypothetical protein
MLTGLIFRVIPKNKYVKVKKYPRFAQYIVNMSKL